MSPSAPSPDVDAGHVLRRNAERNLETQHAWGAFAGHRRQMMALMNGLPAGGRLGILGAGNANDVDLAVLIDRFDEIHLVDLDADAVGRGVAMQGVEPGRVRVHGSVDLTGIVDLLDRWFTRPPDDAELDDALARIELSAPLDGVGGAFDVLVSACVLTQLIDACVGALGESHPRLAELVLAVRDGHIRGLLGSTRPGGTALLVTDLVSTDTTPEIATVPAAGLANLARSRIAAGDFFTGTNPVAIRAALATDPSLAPLVASSVLHRPWRWDLGERSYLVYALSIQRR